MADTQRKLMVQKYGGTSVADAARFRAVAARIKESRGLCDGLAVVVSAMAGETNRLLDLAKGVSGFSYERELDVLLASGEQVAAALLTMALIDNGVPAVSLLGDQVRIATDSSFGRARIKSIDVARVEEVFAQGAVAVVAGFQGVDADHNITTLGRGGSDMSAVALAAALGAGLCEIYTDVAGVFTTDPRICPRAVKLNRISYDEMLELAGVGARVLQTRSVECASRYRVPVHVRSSFSDEEGTWVVPEDQIMEEVLVSGVAYERDEAKVTVHGLPDSPGLAASVFGALADAGVVVDMIVQTATIGEDDRTDITFTVGNKDLDKAIEIMNGVASKVGARDVISSNEVGKVSVVGLGMRNHAGVASRMFRVLADEGINIQMISTSEIKISVIVDAALVDKAVNALHKTFINGGATGTQAG